jgi:hypothetical protein
MLPTRWRVPQFVVVLRHVCPALLIDCKVVLRLVVSCCCGAFPATLFGVQRAHADESDSAVKRLEAKLSNGVDVAVVLGLRESNSSKEGSKEDSLKEAFESAGLAIARERKFQRKHPLSFFPCKTLLSAGRRLLHAWQANSVAMRRVVQVYRMLEEDLKQYEECLKGSLSRFRRAGQLAKEKDELVKDLCNARKVHKKKSIDLILLRTVMETGDAKEARNLLQARKLPVDTTLETLRRETRAAFEDVTTVMLKLTGRIQYHFPEVSLFVGKGLPSELVALWRPSQSLDSFDEKERIETNSRHDVWRVRDSETWFVIKEYRITN